MLWFMLSGGFIFKYQDDSSPLERRNHKAVLVFLFCFLFCDCVFCFGRTTFTGLFECKRSLFLIVKTHISDSKVQFSTRYLKQYLSLANIKIKIKTFKQNSGEFS